MPECKYRQFVIKYYYYIFFIKYKLTDVRYADTDQHKYGTDLEHGRRHCE